MHSIQTKLGVSRFLMALTFTTAFALAAVDADPDTGDVKLPASRQGIFVTAICGRGCVPAEQKCTVYLLSAKKHEHWPDRKELEEHHRGQTPLVISGLTPGVYIVGVQASVNPDTMPDSLAKGTMQNEQTGSKVACFFVDDMREGNTTWQDIAFEEREDGEVYLNVKATHTVAWYRVTVQEGKLTPVVAAFLPAGDSLKDWASSYPLRPAFATSMSPKILATLWQSIESSSPLVPANHFSGATQDTLTRLLIRGGKIMHEIPSGHLVVQFNAEGLPEVLYRARLANAQNGAMNTASSLVPHARMPATGETGVSQTLFPEYTAKLQGRNEVRIRNPNSYGVNVALRCGKSGLDFTVGPEAVKSVYTGDGLHDVYFVYSNEPKALYKGESFTLKGNGVEIQLVQVVGGNYSINRAR